MSEGVSDDIPRVGGADVCALIAWRSRKACDPWRTTPHATGLRCTPAPGLVTTREKRRG